MGKLGKSAVSALVASALCFTSTAAVAAGSTVAPAGSAGCATMAATATTAAQASATRPGCVIPQGGVPVAVAPPLEPVVAGSPFLGGWILPALIGLAAIVAAALLLKKNNNGSGSLSRG